MGRLLDCPAPRHVRGRAHRPLRGRRAHRVLRGHQRHHGPDPILAAAHVSYVVWAPRTALAEYLSHDPRWHVVDRTSVALVFARR